MLIRCRFYQIVMPAFLLLEMYGNICWHYCKGRYKDQAFVPRRKMWGRASIWFIKTIAWWWRISTLGDARHAENTRVNVWRGVLPQMRNNLLCRWRSWCTMLKVLLLFLCSLQWKAPRWNFLHDTWNEAPCFAGKIYGLGFFWNLYAIVVYLLPLFMIDFYFPSTNIWIFVWRGIVDFKTTILSSLASFSLIVKQKELKMLISSCTMIMLREGHEVQHL